MSNNLMFYILVFMRFSVTFNKKCCQGGHKLSNIYIGEPKIRKYPSPPVFKER